MAGSARSPDAASAPDQDATLDGNAAAGLLMELFGVEMTDAPCHCAHCGNRAPMAGLVAYTRAPGLVLRCRVCTQVVLRAVTTPRGTFVDASGIARVRMPPAG